MAEAIIDRNEIEEKDHLAKELAEGYKGRIAEEKQLALEWDITSGDGID